MLANKTYAEAKRKFVKGDDDYTSWTDLSRALRCFHLNPMRPRWAGKLSEKHQRTHSLQKALSEVLAVNAILKVNVAIDDEWHWVVWDARRRKLLDPEDRSVARVNRKYKVCSIMPVPE